MSLSREPLCSGETLASPSMSCQPWCQLCALGCGSSPGKSPIAVLYESFWWHFSCGTPLGAEVCFVISHGQALCSCRGV